MIKKTLNGYFKDFNKESNQVRFVASSDSVDRDGESIRADGWVLDNFLKNPVLLWSHDAHSLPIGKVVNAQIDQNSLITDVEFAEKENPFAKMVSDLVKGKFLNAVSVGFMPLAYDNDGKMIKQELLELSVVNVPANQDALRSNEYQAFCKSLEKMEKKDAKVEAIIKSPACCMEGESKDECISRKIPEIMREDPSTKQDQAVAMAESMCSKPCKEPEEDKDIKPEVKEGRIISEKNRNTMRIAMDGMKQAQDALNELLTQTEPPAKKGEVNTQELQPSVREKRIYDKVRIVDHLVEAIIHDIKNGGEIK